MAEGNPNRKDVPPGRLDNPPKPPGVDRQAYWRSQVRRTVGLLIIWAIVGFGLSILGVEYLNGFTFNNMPLGFWIAQQGAIIVFVLLILTYAILTQRAEAE